MFAIFLACVFLHPMSALAQEFGDQMVTIDKAEIKEGEVVVEVLVRGQILAIEEMKGDRFSGFKCCAWMDFQKTLENAEGGSRFVLLSRSGQMRPMPEPTRRARTFSKWTGILTKR